MGGLNVKNTIAERFFQIVAPHLCSGCGKIGTVLCGDCKYDIIHEPFTGCVLCGKPQRGGVCTSHAASFEQAFVVGTRDTALKACIDAYKFSHAKANVRALAVLLDARLPALPSSTCISTIPTVRAHVRQRGYDHAELLAKEFARVRGLTFQPTLRRVNRSTQHTVDRKTREAQANTAFAARDVSSAPLVLIIDDIITTGATISAAAKALNERGVAVWCAALAYQPLD